jgi:hypothetical protein
VAATHARCWVQRAASARAPQLPGSRPRRKGRGGPGWWGGGGRGTGYIRMLLGRACMQAGSLPGWSRARCAAPAGLAASR